VLACRSTAVRSALVLSAKGAPRAATMDVAWDASTPVLTRFERGGISCSVVSAAILCRNRSGYTISLGRHRIGAAG